MKSATSLTCSGADTSPAMHNPAGAFIQVSARLLPALDSDGVRFLPAPRRALTASDALRAAGFRKIPALWVQERDLDAIIAFAERYADRVNEIRADVRKDTK